MSLCPSTGALEAFASGACDDDAVGSHVSACATCRAAIEEIRENNSFLAGVRTALAAHSARGSAANEASATVEPTPVSGYEIQEEIHRGGQGVVYRAVQTRTRRTVAIKVLLSGRGTTRRQKERFERETRIAAGLDHPNIVTVHDSGPLSDGRYGLVMEHIEGVPLDRWSRSLHEAGGRQAQRQALRERLRVMATVCDAVLCAHQHSIVHRDLKPANILVDKAGEPHILDFGIARDTGPNQHTRLTHTGEFAGTLAYASPEQLSGDLAKVDARTDIYSLGVIMYELVSGRMPYTVDGSMARIIRSIESDEPAPLPRRTRDHDLPWVDGEVSTIILKAMAKDPARRYQTVAGLRDDINHYLAGEAIEARRDSTWYILRKTAARHRMVVTAAGVIITLLAAFGASMAWQAHRLDVRGRELTRALANSNIERGRVVAAAGDIALAEETVWPELLRAGVNRIDGPEAGFIGSPEALRAYWALWDITRMSSSIATLRPGGGAIELLFFEDDGRQLSAVDSKGNLHSWTVATWELVRSTSLITPADGVSFHAALAPCGNIGLFNRSDIFIVNPATGDIVAQADDLDDQPVTGAFSPDGAYLATIGLDNRLRIRDVRTLAIIHTMAELTDHNDRRGRPSFNRPTFSPDGLFIAAARPRESPGLWDASTGALARSLPLPESLPLNLPRMSDTSIAFDGRGAIAAGMGPHNVIWPADGSPPRHLVSPFATIRDVVFLPGSNGRLLVSSGIMPGGGRGTTIIWDVETGEQVATFKYLGETVRCAASPDGRLIAVSCRMGRVSIFDAASEPHVEILRPSSRPSPGSILTLSPDGRMLAMNDTPEGQATHGVHVIDLGSRATICRIDGYGRMGDLAFSPDGSSLLGCETSGRIVQWDVPSGAMRRVFEFPEIPERVSEPVTRDFFTRNGFNQMRVSSDGRMLARARDDGLIGLWDLSSGGWIDWLDSGSTRSGMVDFSPDSTMLAAHHVDSFALWEVETRRPLSVVPTAHGYPAVRFSSTGAVIARGIRGRIQFVDARSGRILNETDDPRASGMAKVFYPGDTVLFATARDSSIRLWDTRTGQQLLSLQKHTGVISSLVLTPDGNTLISSDTTGLVLAWDLTYYNDHIRRALEDRIAREAQR